MVRQTWKMKTEDPLNSDTDGSPHPYISIEGVRTLLTYDQTNTENENRGPFHIRYGWINGQNRPMSLGAWDVLY